MENCAYCGSNIIAGGKKECSLKFCNEECFQKGSAYVAKRLTEEMITEHVLTVHQGTCPKCQGSGPVDVYVSYRVWSAAVYISWSTRQQVSCRSCGISSNVGNSLFSLFLGWSCPLGLFLIPIQMGRNAISLLTSPDPARPSAALRAIVKANLMAELLAGRDALGDQEEKEEVLKSANAINGNNNLTEKTSSKNRCPECGNRYSFFDAVAQPKMCKRCWTQREEVGSPS
jgi:ribosomal protein S14